MGTDSAVLLKYIRYLEDIIMANMNVYSRDYLYTRFIVETYID